MQDEQTSLARLRVRGRILQINLSMLVRFRQQMLTGLGAVAVGKLTIGRGREGPRAANQRQAVNCLKRFAAYKKGSESLAGYTRYA